MYFYPEAATPGCTTEACDFRDNLATLQGSGYEVLGISPDAPEKLAHFTGDFALTFPLLADEDHAVALAYGAWGEKLVDGEVHEGIVRSTVVLGPEGKVRWPGTRSKLRATSRRSTNSSASNPRLPPLPKQKPDPFRAFFWNSPSLTAGPSPTLSHFPGWVPRKSSPVFV